MNALRDLLAEPLAIVRYWGLLARYRGAVVAVEANISTIRRARQDAEKAILARDRLWIELQLVHTANKVMQSSERFDVEPHPIPQSLLKENHVQIPRTLLEGFPLDPVVPIASGRRGSSRRGK